MQSGFALAQVWHSSPSVGGTVAFRFGLGTSLALVISSHLVEVIVVLGSGTVSQSAN